MTAPTTTPEITQYRDAVRAALADLSAEDRDDLMDDVEPHLIEVAAEGDGSLARLGSPAQYATELRTSAGLPGWIAPVQRSSWVQFTGMLANSGAGRGVERLTGNPWARSVRAFLPELRPGWWVLRGYLLAWVFAGLFFGDSPLVPRIGNGFLIGLLVTAVAIWASVRLGLRARTNPPRRAWRIWGRVFVGALLLATFFLLITDNPGPENGYYGSGQPQPGVVGVSNVYVFDSEGRPLTGVQLFDQDGRPLTTSFSGFDSYGNPITVRPYIDANGNEVYNVYPLLTEQGGLPGRTVPVPRVTPAPASSPEPSAVTSPTVPPSGPPAGPTASPTPR